MTGKKVYRPPWWLRNGHVQTLLAVARRAKKLSGFRERVETPDGDFFDLDFFPVAPGRRAEKAVLLSHGLEGHSRRPYMSGMAAAFQEQGWDAVSRNFRGCSGEMNRLPLLYHAGQTEDLELAVRRCVERGYTSVFLIGFSLGGNQVLKYLGEDPDRVPDGVIGAAAVSAPCDMEGAAAVLARPSRRVYTAYFLRTLRAKIRIKHARFPDFFDTTRLDRLRTFNEFDELYTAPLHGFASARDYWRKSAALPVLERIRVPVLLVQARDDPFLSPGCFPYAAAERNPLLHLEITGRGGHVGFLNGFPRAERRTWAEERLLQFAQSVAGNG